MSDDHPRDCGAYLPRVWWPWRFWRTQVACCSWTWPGCGTWHSPWGRPPATGRPPRTPRWTWWGPHLSGRRTHNASHTLVDIMTTTVLNIRPGGTVGEPTWQIQQHRYKTPFQIQPFKRSDLSDKLTGSTGFIGAEGFMPLRLSCQRAPSLRWDITNMAPSSSPGL